MEWSSQFPVLSSQRRHVKLCRFLGGKGQKQATKNRNSDEEEVENRELLLGLGLRLQLDVSALHLDRVLHRGAAVLLAQFASLLPDERREGTEVAGDLLS